MNKLACEGISSFLVMDVLERARELEAAGERVIHLQIGEPGFAPPACVNEAALKAVADGETHYTHSQGLIELREAICAYYAKDYKVEVSPDRVLVTSGTSPAMLLSFAALAGAGDNILISDPSYACYPNFIRFIGACERRVPTPESQGFQFEPDEIPAYVDARTRAIVLNSPSNPTGTLLAPDKLEKICHMGIPVVSDEIYHGLTYGCRAVSALEYSDQAIVLNGFSKLQAMTGWRLGYLIAPKRLMPSLRSMQQNFLICAGSVAQRAGIAALSDEARPEIEAMRLEYAKRREVMLAGLRDMGFKIAAEPAGAFYVMFDARRYGQDSLKLAFDILEEVKVGVTPGIDFGPAGEGYLRLCYAASLEDIEEGLSRLKAYFAAR